MSGAAREGEGGGERNRDAVLSRATESTDSFFPGAVSRTFAAGDEDAAFEEGVCTSAWGGDTVPSRLSMDSSEAAPMSDRGRRRGAAAHWRTRGRWLVQVTTVLRNSKNKKMRFYISTDSR